MGRPARDCQAEPPTAGGRPADLEAERPATRIRRRAKRHLGCSPGPKPRSREEGPPASHGRRSAGGGVAGRASPSNPPLRGAGGSFGRAPHTLLAALPCELTGTSEVSFGAPSENWPSALWRSAGDAVLRHTQSRRAGQPFDVWWQSWHHLGVAGGTSGSRLKAWRRVLALDDRKDPVVRWWLGGGRGDAPEAVFPLV